MNTMLDTVIIGGGAAGLTAGLTTIMDPVRVICRKLPLFVSFFPSGKSDIS
jgi:thioredoxin reductase